MTKFLKIIFVASVIVFLAAGCNQQSTDQPVGQSTNQQRQQIQVSQSVEGVDIGFQPYLLYADETKTALEVLKIGHNVEVKNFSGVGDFVIGINGQRAENGKNFWSFYVNGQQAPVGAGDYKVKNGDRIEWKLENIK